MTDQKNIPVISILMAVYNTEAYLPAAIESVLRQTFQQWELICINDGSTDNCLNLLRQYQAKDPRIVVLDRPHCGTCAGTKNAGLALARGEFTAQVDSDDRIELAYLEKLIARQQQTQADIVIPTICYCWDHANEKVTRVLAGVNGDNSKILTGREAFPLSLHWEIGGIGLHRTDTLKEVQYCEIGMLGDEYTTRLLLLRANRVAFCDAQYFYRQNPNSITRRFSYKLLSMATNLVMILQLIRKNKFGGPLFVGFKEEVILSVISSHIVLVKKKHHMTPHERKVARRLLFQTTRDVCKECFLPPYSAAIGFRIAVKMLRGIIRRVKKVVGVKVV
jgi:glycosyltransferase involved in cell wall biosynthesis